MERSKDKPWGQRGHDNRMKKDISYLTELDKEYAQSLLNVKDAASFQKFLDEWECWLDEESQDLVGSDWRWLEPLIADTRKEGITPEDKHEPAISLVLPKKIFRVTITANHFKVPWGTAYIRMHEQGLLGV
jgi:hypothetical protein